MTRVRAGRGALALVVAVATVALGSCGGSRRTAVRVALEPAAGVVIDQVRLDVGADGATASREVFPPTPTDALAAAGDVLLLLADAWAGRSIDVYAAGLRDGAQVASGQGRVGVRRGATVTVTVRLVAAACASGTHDCGGECAADDDVARCGTSCEPCPAPSPRAGASRAYDSVRHVVVLYGGLASVDLGDTWELHFDSGGT